MKIETTRKAVKLAPAAAVTSALLVPATYGASGDLDPAFGDLGRLGPILNGPAWSIEPQEDGSILLGGGDSYYYYYYYYFYYGLETTNFVGLWSDTGVPDPAFVAGDLGNAQIFGVTRQADGAIVAVGRAVVNGFDDTRLIVFRLLADGSLDADFGDNGRYSPGVQEFGSSHAATSVALDDDGRIVVAGIRGGKLIVLRLMPDGTLDESFGSAGVFEGPAVFDYPGGREGVRSNLIRTESGGYRVTASTLAGCQVVALGSDGTPDNSFGTDGVATVDTPAGSPVYCSSMAEQADGRLLVAGTAGPQGFASRLLEDGGPDPGFSAGAIGAAMSEATAINVGEDGSVVVAGTGVSGLSIMRLQASGELDVVFGQGGSATVDLYTNNPVALTVRDMFIQADNGIVAAGGVDRHDWSIHGAFVARLLGDGGQSPGVVGIVPRTDWRTVEGDGEIVLDVRRSGGSAGSVSVDWETGLSGNHTDPPYYAVAAVPGEDYGLGGGVLTWGDGDTTPRQVHIPIIADFISEEPESFRVVLTGSEGGAGLGQSGATILIDADGGPFGQFGFVADIFSAGEGGSARIEVFRNFYSSGTVSVTVTPVPGTATAGNDFVADPVTLTWNDGDAGWKFAAIPIVDDTAEEQAEDFTVELSNPTGGAVIGPHSVATVHIPRNDVPPAGGSGGGAVGWLSLLLLGVMRLVRRRTAASSNRFGS